MNSGSTAIAHSLAVSRSESSRRKLSPWLYYILAILAYAIIFSLWQAESMPADVYLAGVLLCAICLFPLCLWARSGTGRLPLFELICVAYLVEFGVSMYVQPPSIVILSREINLAWDDIRWAELAASVGVASFILGFMAFRRAIRLPALAIELPSNARDGYIWCSVGIGLCAAVARVSGFVPPAGSPVGMVLGVAALLLNIGLALLAYDVYAAPQRPIFKTVALYILLLVSFAFGLASGLLENAFIPLVIVFLMLWNARQRFPLLLLIIGGLAFFALNPVKGAYRQFAWYGTSSPSIEQKLSLWWHLSSNAIPFVGEGAHSTDVNQYLSESTSRFDLLHKFAYVHTITPRYVPYFHGESYTFFVYGWIPSAIWPSKPAASSVNTKFDLAYKLVTPDQISGTQISIGQLPEAYANFGYFGIVVVLFAMGGVISLFDQLLDGSNSELLTAIYVVSMVIVFNGIGSSAVIIFMGVAKQVVIYLLLLYVIYMFRERSESRSLRADFSR